MDALVALPLALALLAGGGFIVNEWSHGGLSEAAGLGHHHLADDDAWHCAHGDAAGMDPAHACPAGASHAAMEHAAMHGGAHPG